MRASVPVTIVAALALAALTLGATPAAAAAAADLADFCSRCDTSGLRFRLLRGEAEAEAASCLQGRYCDCDLGRPQQCFAAGLGRRFNEATQRCEFNFDCRAWLQANPATEADGEQPASLHG